MGLKGLRLSLVLILLLGLFLRIYKINHNSLYGDELAMTYDAYSILHTQKDLSGEFMPFTFQTRDGGPPGYVYFSIPFVALLGPSILSIRILSVVSGVSLIYLSYLFGNKLFGKKGALWSSFFMAVTPWAINLSRGGFETNFALALSVSGLYLFLFKKKLFWPTLLWILAMFTYPTYKLTLPLLGVYLLLSKKININYKRPSKEVLMSFVLLVFALLTLLYQSVFSGSEGRFANLNIFTNKSVVERTAEAIDGNRKLYEGAFPSLFYNKPVALTKRLARSYLTNFSPKFLVVEGDAIPRHNMTQTGVIFYVQLIFVLVGLFTMFSKKHKYARLIAAILLISPAASSLLGEVHSLRNSLYLFPLILLSAKGVMVSFKKTHVFSWLLILFISLESLLALNNLFFLSPNKQAKQWGSPARKVVDFVTDNRENFDTVIISDRIENIYFAYPTYSKIHPSKHQHAIKNYKTVEGYNFLVYGNVHIGYIPPTDYENLIKNFRGDLLVLETPLSDNYLEMKKIKYDKDGLPAFVYNEIVK